MRNFSKIFAIFIALKLNLVIGIHYGNIAQRNQFPYAVLVHSPQFFCSGALISDRHIITAAHCLMSIRKGGKVTVNVGAHEYYGSRFTDGKTISSDKFWMHENFTMPSAVFDIGVIELPESLPRSEKIGWLKLSTRPDADLDPKDKEVYLAGWGYSESSYGVAEELRWTKMDLIPLKECMKYKSHYIEDMNKDHICTRKTEGMPCSGDSGSVIVSKKTNKILGVVSYVKDAENGIDMGYNDCDSDIPVASTRISSYIDWINNKTGINFTAGFEQDDNSNLITPTKLPNKVTTPTTIRPQRKYMCNTAKTTSRPNTERSSTENLYNPTIQNVNPHIKSKPSLYPSISNTQLIITRSRRRRSF
ncbi:hypothetical protein ACKWTF_012530 [Chironomus riparius]